MLKRNLFLLALLLFVVSCSAVDASDWQTDYAKALQMAKAQNKRVLLDFTGSDWCGPCIELRKRVFSQPEFRKYAEKNLILIEVDYPQRKKQSAELKKQNEKLGGQYGIDEKGFPTVVLLDPSGKILREFTGYGGESAAAFIGWIEGKNGD
jgi:protein disulfide-isomerase